MTRRPTRPTETITDAIARVTADTARVELPVVDIDRSVVAAIVTQRAKQITRKKNARETQRRRRRNHKQADE